jgi:hypothetical protein
MLTLHNDEHFEFFRHVITLTREVGAATLDVVPQFDALLAAHLREDEVLKKITKSELTATWPKRVSTPKPRPSTTCSRRSP